MAISDVLCPYGPPLAGLVPMLPMEQEATDTNAIAHAPSRARLIGIGGGRSGSCCQQGDELFVPGEVHRLRHAVTVEPHMDRLSTHVLREAHRSADTGPHQSEDNEPVIKWPWQWRHRGWPTRVPPTMPSSAAPNFHCPQ